VAQLLERAGRIEDLSKAPQLYKVFKKEFKRLLDDQHSSAVFCLTIMIE